MTINEDHLASKMGLYERRFHDADTGARMFLAEMHEFPLAEGETKSQRDDTVRRTLQKWLRFNERTVGGSSLSQKERALINRIIELIQRGDR